MTSIMMRLIVTATIATALAACGGSGAGGQGESLSAGGGSVDSAAATVQLTTDQPQLLSDGSTVATITAIVKDAKNNVLARQPVSMSSDDIYTSLTPEAMPLMTGDSGKASSKLELQAGSLEAKTNRGVIVTATVGKISQSITIPVGGTSLTIDGSKTVASAATADYTVTLKDGGGKPVSGARVSMSSKLGNSIAPIQDSTVDGVAKFRLTGVTGGVDTLTASALGASTTLEATVAAASTVTGLRFSAPEVDVAVNQVGGPITVTYLVGNVPQPNQSLTLALTRGRFPACSCAATNLTTDASGSVTVNVESPTVGVASLTAFLQSDPMVSSNMAVRFFSGAANAAKVSLSSGISSVGINAAGAPANNKSVITATVRDATDNPVQGATVLFSAISDPSGGTLSPATAVTDATGSAASTFTPGGTSSGPNAVEIRSALASNPTITAVTRLTVNEVALFVDLGTGNQISALNTTTYQMPWTAQVTDASQKAVAGQTVTGSLTSAYGGDTSNPTLKYYYKGVWIYSGGAWRTVAFNNHPVEPSGNPVACLNEDVNQNNILDAGEDKNGNKRLDPGAPAAVLVSGVTDINGMVPLTVTYAKSMGYWVNVSLKGTISTSGTESTAQRTFLLPVLAEDLASQDVYPPNVGASIVWGTESYWKGPFGADPTRDSEGFCTSPN